MSWLEIISVLLNAVTGTGLIVSLVTLRSQRRKAKSDADGAELNLAKEYVGEFTENIVEPLRKEMRGLRRTVRNLTNAVEKSNNCAWTDTCPVRDELRKQAEREERSDGA